jgi:hypothetical protein
MNRARQDSITAEIMEIVGGAEALGADEDAHLHIPAADAFSIDALVTAGVPTPSTSNPGEPS